MVGGLRVQELFLASWIDWGAFVECRQDAGQMMQAK
jgi:hypothetical protein